MKNSSEFIKQNKQDYTKKSSYSSAIETSKFKVIASQCFGVLAINITKFSFGNAVGFTAMLIPELYKENPEIDISMDELSWFSSHCFMIPIGSITGGFLAQYLGSRIVFLGSTVFFSIAWLIFYWSTNSVMLLIAQSIMGIIGGIMKGPSFTYIAEITEPRLRGTLMATANVSYVCGHFFAILLRNKFYWRTVTMVNLIFPILAFILFCFLPESPSWLANKNRINDAELSLAWFRGWATPETVKPEFLFLLDKSNRTPIISNGNTNNRDFRSTLWKHLHPTIAPYLRRSFYIPLATMCYIFFINDFGGVITSLVFPIVIFKKIQSPIDEQIASTILSGMRFLGSILCILIIHLLGKQKLSFLSLLSTGISFSFAASFGFLIDNQIIPLYIYSWIPTISFIIAIFSSACGIEKIVFLLNSEIFPTHLRHVGAGMGHLLSNIFLAILNKSFLYIMTAITIYGVFSLFAIFNLIGMMTIYYIVPETENKSLQEIEDYYEGTHKSKKEKSRTHSEL